MILINLYGQNAAGKSTRVTALIKYLESKNIEPELIEAECSDGEIRVVGKIYGDIFVIGGKSTSKKYNGKWVGLDKHHFMKRDDLLNLYLHVSKLNKVKYFVQEGFFMNDTAAYTMDLLKDYGISSYEYYFFMHDGLDNFMNRCNNRSGRSRTKEQMENSAGYKSNTNKFPRIMNRYLEADGDKCLIKKMDVNGDLNFLAIRLFGEDPGYELNDVETWKIKQKKIGEW